MSGKWRVDRLPCNVVCLGCGAAILGLGFAVAGLQWGGLRLLPSFALRLTDATTSSSTSSIPAPADSDASVSEQFPLVGDSRIFKDIHRKAKQDVQRWDCPRPYRGPATSGNRKISIYVYELPPELRLKAPAPMLKGTHWDFEEKVHDVFATSAYRTYDPQEASFFVVPVRLGTCMGVPSGSCVQSAGVSKVIKWMMEFGPYWERNQGADHILTSLQCNTKSLVVPRALHELFMPSLECGPIYACVTASDGRIPTPYRSLVLPYFVPDHFYESGTTGLENRHISLYFSGSLIKTEKNAKLGYGWKGTRAPVVNYVRQYPGSAVYVQDRWGLYQALAAGELKKKIQYNVSHSVFILAPHGDTPESGRIYQALACGAIPVITSGHYIPPFSEILDWSEFAIMFDLDIVLLWRHYFRATILNVNVTLQQSMLKSFLNALATISPSHKRALLKNVSRIRHALQYRTGNIALDALIAQSLAMRTSNWTTR